MLEESEWVRLPGLFRWDEICEVFATEATPDREWHFLVHAASAPGAAERLYVVHAAREAAAKLAAERAPRADG
ncbi:MAG TPA: hypothetical protein VH062_24480 [Polyangiaceae bacterium]|jgi:hypothetical protein|nr:hypothetical protein [Polyangiaceae bacterium]